MGVKVYLALSVAIAALSGCGGSAAPPAKRGPTAATVTTAIQSAESYLAAQRPKEALQVAAKLAQEVPTEMRAHEIYARALVASALSADTPAADKERLMSAAADAYDRATAIDPKHAALHHAAGVVSDTAGRPDAARAHYKAAHEAEPANGQYMLYYGVALARTDQAAQAKQLLEAAEKLSPDSPDAKAALADLALRSGDMDAALKHISAAIALDPTARPLRLAHARILRISNQPRMALAILTAFDEKERMQLGVAEEIALAHASLGNLEDAARAYELCAIASPNDWLAALKTSQAWHRAANPAKALMWLERAQALGAPTTEASDPHQGG